MKMRDDGERESKRRGMRGAVRWGSAVKMYDEPTPISPGQKSRVWATCIKNEHRKRINVGRRSAAKYSAQYTIQQRTIQDGPEVT